MMKVSLVATALFAFVVMPCLASARGTDCNLNGIPDDLDIGSGTSNDCDSNGVPDECQVGTVLYYQDFDGSPSAIGTMGGLWHNTTSCRPAGNCGEASYAYYGLDSTCTFNTGTAHGGNYTLPTLSIPAEGSLELSFCSYYYSEDSGVDLATVFVWTTDWDLLLSEDITFGPHQVWHSWNLEIPGAAGKDVSIRFNFWTDDFLFNDYFGWGVDDVLVYSKSSANDCNQNWIPDACDPDLNGNGIPDDCECLTNNYCISSVNTFGSGAVIGSNGEVGVSANSFVLSVQGAVPHQFGLFFYGAQRQGVLWGEGMLCIKSPFYRLWPIVQADGTGAVTYGVDFTAPPANAGLLTYAESFLQPRGLEMQAEVGAGEAYVAL